MTSPLPPPARQGLFARALRGSAFVASGFVIGQGMRFASNLVLTRILFPEAFGMMALVTMVLAGLSMFSDVGLGPAIMSNKRGDEPRFLNTAWTIQALRGIGLALIACLLAPPLAQFYRAPELALLLPAAALSLVISGFFSMRLETANRHLALGRVTAIELVSQGAGIALMIALAVWTQSIWSLIWGNLLGTAVKFVLISAWLPGQSNRFDWERESARELLRYGAWIFLSTAFGFLLLQGDKAILGRYLSLESLGIYNVGFFLASFPGLLLATVVARIFIPIYREVAAADSPQIRRRLRRMRFALTGGALSLMALVALTGPAVVGLLYDPRYMAAGAIVVAISCIQLPQVIVATYDSSALAAGDSRGFFLVSAVKAVVQTALFLLGAHFGGLAGALLGQGIAALLIAPASMMLAARHRVHDPLHDLIFALPAALLAALALWLASEPLQTLGSL